MKCDNLTIRRAIWPIKEDICGAVFDLADDYVLAGRTVSAEEDFNRGLTDLVSSVSDQYMAQCDVVKLGIRGELLESVVGQGKYYTTGIRSVTRALMDKQYGNDIKPVSYDSAA